MSNPVPLQGDGKTLVILAHASSLIALAISAGWLSFVGPLVMWLLYKDRYPFVREAAAGAFNFNLGMWLMNIVGWILIITIIGIPIGLLLLAVSYVGQFVIHLIATLKASNGQPYRYPLQIPILS